MWHCGLALHSVVRQRVKVKGSRGVTLEVRPRLVFQRVMSSSSPERSPSPPVSSGDDAREAPPPAPPERQREGAGGERLRKQEEDIFACLKAFATALWDVFSADPREQHIPLQVYVSLMEQRLDVADQSSWASIREYVNGYKRFWEEYGPVLKRSCHTDTSWALDIPEDGTILYKGQFAIHLGQLLRNPLSTDAIRRTIRGHLVMLGALVDEDKEEIARFRARAFEAPATREGGGGDSGTDAASFIGELVQEMGLEEGDDMTPEEGLNRMISGGGMQRIMGKMTRQLESGELDIGQLLQGLVGGLSGVLQEEGVQSATGGGSEFSPAAPTPAASHPGGPGGGFVSGEKGGGLTDGLGGMLSTLGTVVGKTGGIQGWNGLVGSRRAPSVDDLDASLDATMERWRERATGQAPSLPSPAAGKGKGEGEGEGGDAPLALRDTQHKGKRKGKGKERKRRK